MRCLAAAAIPSNRTAFSVTPFDSGDFGETLENFGDQHLTADVGCDAQCLPSIGVGVVEFFLRDLDVRADRQRRRLIHTAP